MDKPSDDWQMENHPYSPAGEVEGFGRFADGINRRRRRGQRTAVAAVIVVALLVPMVLGVISVIASSLD